MANSWAAVATSLLLFASSTQAWPRPFLAAREDAPVTIPDARNLSGPNDQYANAPKAATAPQPATGLFAQTTINALSVFEPKVKTFTYAQPMRFLDAQGQPHAVARDLGFSGVLDGKVVWTWGDTLVGFGSADDTQQKYYPTAVDSSTITYDMRYPFLSQDTSMEGSAISSLVPINDQEKEGGGYSHYAFGGTNIIQTRPGYGLMYYLVNHRALGDLEGTTNQILGAGAAEVHLDENDVPVLRRFGDTLWNSTEPTWGATGIAHDPRDDNIYVYGGGPPASDLSNYTFLCRVARGSAADIDAYEYWNNATQTWTKQRFGDGQNGTLETTEDMALFGYLEMNQAAPFWSNYYNRWLFIHGSGYSSTPVLLKSAHSLEGPWTDHGVIAPTKPDDDMGNNMRYAVMGHPEFDNSGKTVVVTWTRANQIWGGVIEWDSML